MLVGAIMIRFVLMGVSNQINREEQAEKTSDQSIAASKISERKIKEELAQLQNHEWAGNKCYSAPYRGMHFRNSQSRRRRGMQARSLKSQASMPTV